MFINKDQLTNYLIKGDIHLSKKDYGFFTNINTQISNRKPITSNQDKLFSKLLFKYKRQFNNLGYNVEQLNLLLWHVEVIASQEQYLSAKISIENDKIIIRCPYNTKFIQKFKNISNNYFTWQKATKCYTATLSTHNLKLAYYEVNKYFENVRYDSSVQFILDEVATFKNCIIWNPTLIKVGNNFYVYGLNESLNKAIQDIKLSDEPNTLLKLSQFGIEIDKSILQDDKLRQFASTFYAIVDIDDIKDLANWLKILNYDLIYLGSDIIFNKEISKDIKETLGDIPMTRKSDDLDLYDNVIYLNYNSYKRINPSFLLIDDNKDLHKNISKVLTITNSRPIFVK